MRLFPLGREFRKRNGKNKGRQSVSHTTANGIITINRYVFWNKETGSNTDLDQWLGLESGFSIFVRELCCLVTLGSNSFMDAQENLYKLAQLRVSHNTISKISQEHGKDMADALSKGLIKPEMGIDSSKMIIVDADGVMVPVITEVEKKKRQETYEKRAKSSDKKNDRKTTAMQRQRYRL